MQGSSSPPQPHLNLGVSTCQRKALTTGLERLYLPILSGCDCCLEFKGDDESETAGLVKSVFLIWANASIWVCVGGLMRGLHSHPPRALAAGSRFRHTGLQQAVRLSVIQEWDGAFWTVETCLPLCFRKPPSAVLMAPSGRNLAAGQGVQGEAAGGVGEQTLLDFQLGQERNLEKSVPRILWGGIQTGAEPRGGVRGGGARNSPLQCISLFISVRPEQFGALPFGLAVGNQRFLHWPVPSACRAVSREA